jgi:hypothetical protein
MLRVIASNPSGGGSNCAFQSTPSPENHNLSSDASCAFSISNGSLIDTDPLLALPGSYGGLTQTLARLPGSPAIDAGGATCSHASDQRGVARPQGSSCDIGAFESRGFTLGSATGTPQSAVIQTSFSSPSA